MAETWTTLLWKYIQEAHEPNVKFTRQALLVTILPRVVKEIGSVGKTPDQTMSRELQHLKHLGLLYFKQRGNYEYPRRELLLPADIKYQGEAIVARVLLELGIKYFPHKRFVDLKGKDEHGIITSHLHLDFYLEIEKVKAIEFDGGQHREPVPNWGGMPKLIIQQRNDRIKDRWCRNKGIPLLRCITPKIDIVREQILSFLNEDYKLENLYR